MITRRRWLAAAPVLITAGCRWRHGTAFRGYAFVANQDGQAVAAVDLSAFAVARHIHLDGNPTSVVAHPSRPFVYALTPANGAVHEIEADRLSLRRSLAAGGEAISMRLSPDARSLYVLCRQPRSLVRIALPGFAIDARIALPETPADFDVAPDGRLAGISFGQAASLSFADLETGVCEPPIAAGATLGAVRFQSDGNAVIAADLGRRMLSIYDTSSRRLIVHLPLAVRPDNLCFNGDGGQLFVTGDGMDAVVVVYPYHTPEVAKTVLAGRAPGAMAASSTPGYLFVANPASGDVTVLNILTARVIAVASVGAEPGYIAITPDNQYALVLNRKSGDMAVLRIAAITAIETST
ncbi:MAG: hypothetical protein ABI165_21850, partial [Bryobacteraceae bacterium]